MKGFGRAALVGAFAHEATSEQVLKRNKYLGIRRELSTGDKFALVENLAASGCVRYYGSVVGEVPHVLAVAIDVGFSHVVGKDVGAADRIDAVICRCTEQNVA